LLDITMSEPPDPLAQQIAALEAALRLPLPEESRRQLLDNLQALQAAARPAGDVVAGDKVLGDKVMGDKVVAPHGTVTVGDDARVDGVVVGINLGRIVYGRDPAEDERRQLVWYLARLAKRLARLPLRGMAARLDDGPGVALPRVYVLPAIDDLVELGPASARALRHYFQPGDAPKQLKPEHTLDWALPADAVAAIAPAQTKATEAVLLRPRLATEAIREHPRLVLLGDAGAGKSIVLRHLAWALALRGLDQHSDATALFGWGDETRLVPLLLPLRRLAERIAAMGATMAAVSAAMRDELTREYDVRQADALLDKTLAGETALLLFDGLDEVPLVATPDVIADRVTTLQAVRAFAELHSGTRVVLTCRTRAFDDTLRASLGWPTKTITPFTLGQIRRFVAGWFATLIEREAIVHHLAVAQQTALVDAIAQSARLRAMAENPLLLTMLAIMLAERGELQHDRPVLYERIVEQLLGQWDRQKGRQSLADILGAPNLRSNDLRSILDELSYNIHADAATPDGRGRLASKDLRYALAEFLEHKQVAGAWEAAGRCLDYLVERSGLLIPEDDATAYLFAHLTLQEHCAGRHVLLAPNAVELVMRYRGDDHWREPIALGLGVLHKLYPALADRIDRILTELIDLDERGAPKSRERWYRDLLLAAELGQERDWQQLRALINVDRLQRDLRRGLVALLHDTDQTLPVAERVRAGLLLGDLGDPRFPISLGDWRQEIQRAGAPGGYFCAVPPHTGDPTIWIARYPITNAQLREWASTTSLPPRRQATDTHFNHPNQPATGITWHLASAFCAWLSQQLSATIRLPSEAEWEAAARGQDGRRYPWGNERLNDRAASKDDHDRRAWPYPVPVGCYPAGASAVGALDMAGNIWEWTSDLWQPDAQSAPSRNVEEKRALRGGGYLSKKKHMQATARIGLAPAVGFDNGFRIVLEIQSGDSGG
jgi:hypothetical protein